MYQKGDKSFASICIGNVIAMINRLCGQWLRESILHGCAGIQQANIRRGNNFRLMPRGFFMIGWYACGDEKCANELIEAED